MNGRIGVALLIASSFLVSGCRCVKTCIEQPFPGLRTNLMQTAANRGTLRLLIVHGMTTHTQGYSSNFVTTIADKLGLSSTSNSLVALTNATGVTNGFFGWSDFRGHARESNDSQEAKHLRAYELTWSPATAPEKAEKFTFDSRLDYKRARLNRQLKATLLNDGFADAVLYLSDGYRSKIQEPVTNAIQRILADNFSTNDQFVIITHSLGSKLTFDSLQRMTEHFSQASTRHAQRITNFAAQTTYMIMFANQIPLLQLGETRAAVEPGHQKPVQQFLEMRQQGVKARENLPAATNVLWVLAVTDPNDLLSYPLQPPNFMTDSHTDIRFGNVFVCNAPALFGWVANPLDAHEDYFTNTKLVKLLINGYHKRVRSCIRQPRQSSP